MKRTKHYTRYIIVALLGWLFNTGGLFVFGRLLRFLDSKLISAPGISFGNPATRNAIHEFLVPATSLPSCAIAAAFIVLLFMYLRWPIDNPKIDYEIEQHRQP